MNTRRPFLRWTLSFAALAAFGASAQQAGTLYDPEPPADSAYVRFIVLGSGAVDVLVDGKPRVTKLAAGTPSDYLVLGAGARNITLQAAGKPGALLSTAFEAGKGKAYTLAFASTAKDTKPVVFEDKANTNKLKAVLGVYHLHPKAGPVDVLTADGATKAFADLAPGAPASLQVNPIDVELIVAKPGSKAALGQAKLAMTQGATYSLFLLPADGGKFGTVALQNKTERYTAKP
jgi:alginate O-acetyltransferase complex protein AlgF